MDAILDFWFGGLPVFGSVPAERLRFWFGGGAEVDRLIGERFGNDLERAMRGEYDHWAERPRGTLALIVLLDQFPRNIHRGTSRAYACDAQVLRLCLAAMAEGQDLELSILERAFFYLPLEHSEDLRMQRRSVRAFESLLSVAPAARREMCASFLDYAVRHRRIIERFGRFPHRNVALGRTSSVEEEAFLQEPGSSF